jgi:hypothetical protein
MRDRRSLARREADALQEGVVEPADDRVAVVVLSVLLPRTRPQ